MFFYDALKKNKKNEIDFYDSALSKINPVYTPYVNRDGNGEHVQKVGEVIGNVKLCPCNLKTRVDYYD